MRRFPALALAGLLLPATSFAQTATLFGSLANFDVLNDTGQQTEGFEIELDGVQPQQISFTFGGTYNRYGSPSIVPFAGGVYVRYMAQWDANAGAFNTATPVATSLTPTAGHQCWSGAMGMAAYLASGCEHFGVGTIATPTNTVYRWLVADPQNPGSLIPRGAVVSIPAPVWTLQPPAQAGAQPAVVAQIDPPVPPQPEAQFGDAQWVKVYKTELAREVGLDELLSDNPVVPQDPAELETAWSLLQSNPNGKHKRNQRNGGAINSGTRSVVRRYEFYKYTGQYDPLTHEALCADLACNAPADGEVGDYIGAQMAAALVGVPSMTISRAGSGNVNGTVGAAKISCGNVCSVAANQGDLATLTASPNSGNAFSGWSGACSGEQATCSVAVNDQLAATASFTPVYTLSIGRGGSGAVAGAPGGAFATAIDCGPSCSAKFALNTMVTLAATPAGGLRFTGWGGACAGTDPTCSVLITGDTKVQASFAK